MAYRDVLVHLDGDSRRSARLSVAVTLARTFGARLTGFFGESDPHVMSSATRDPAAALGPVERQVEGEFRQQAAAAGVETDWLTAMTVNDTELIKRLLFAAHHTDLVVLGQHPAADARAGLPADLVEQITLNCGRPVLCVPWAGRSTTVGKRVLVAWNGSREATRAVGDALPLLEQAERVVLLAVNPDFSRKQYGEEPCVPMRRYLLAHGIDARCESLWLKDDDVVAGLLSRIADEGMDLLVMGAHGHYGFPYLHQGGSTRQILQTMTTPVLIAH